VTYFKKLELVVEVMTS